MAPKSLGRCLLLTLALAAPAGCNRGKSEEAAADSAAAAHMAVLRARRDSVLQARQQAEADSVARVTYAACTDSVATAMKKTKKGRKALATKLPDGMIRPEFMSACGAPPGGAVMAVKAVIDSASGDAPTASTGPTASADAPKLTAKQLQVLRADSIRRVREQAEADSLARVAELAQADSLARAQADSVRTDSITKANETEVLRETFAYSGGSRDPFNSLIKSAKLGPELSDLQVVGIYQDLRYAANSVAVVRDKSASKRYKLRVGDQLGRLKVVQIRQVDVVFTIEDLGFERQETLSLRKREAQTP